MATAHRPPPLHPQMLLGYDRFARLMGATPMYWQLVAQAGIQPASTVLEIGCGTGNVLLRAKRSVPSATVIGVDPDADGLAAARRKADEEGLEVQLDHGDASALPYADGSVDRVLSSMMWHHLPADGQADAAREVRRVLAPGGSLHLVDVDTDPRTHGPMRPITGLLSRRHRHGVPPHHQEHGHPRGHGHGQVRRILDVLASEGFAAPSLVGRGHTRMGAVTYLRAQ